MGPEVLHGRAHLSRSGMRSLSRPFACVAVATLTACGVAGAQQRGAFLGDLAWPDAERRIREAPLVILPFGAGAKEHGPQLPLGTDRIVMEYLTRVATDSLAVIVAPPMAHHPAAVLRR